MGLTENYKNAMEQAKKTYLAVYKDHPAAAAYVLPNAFNRRVILKMNLRSALHLIKLRSAPNAHFAMRRAAQKIAEDIRHRYPLFAPYFEIDTDEADETIEKEFFLQTH